MVKTLKDCLETGGVNGKIFLAPGTKEQYAHPNGPYKVESVELVKHDEKDPEKTVGLRLKVLTASRIPANFERLGAGREYLHLEHHLEDIELPSDTKLPIYDGVIIGVPPGPRPSY